MSSHAILSPSSASRWLSCTPSARLEEQFPDRAGEAAAEGTLAHALAELSLRRVYPSRLGAQEADIEERIEELRKNPLYDHSMEDYIGEYVNRIRETFEEAITRTKDAVLAVEQRLDLSDYVPEGFGTGDAVIIADGVLEIVDLKYGKGVPVFAKDNRQMMLYGLGALSEFDLLYDIRFVRMSIHQPRIDNFSTWEIDAEALKRWGTEYLKPRAALAFEGKGDFVPGDHCRFCRASACCRALAKQNLEIAKLDFAPADTLSDLDLADVLSRSEDIRRWLSSVEDYALCQAVENGKHWQGFKLVEGRSNRTYSDSDAVAERLRAAGYPEEILFTRNLLTITALEKAIGKKAVADTVGELIIKPQGKPTLVPETDKRPPLDRIESAKQDFS